MHLYTHTYHTLVLYSRSGEQPSESCQRIIGAAVLIGSIYCLFHVCLLLPVTRAADRSFLPSARTHFYRVNKPRSSQVGGGGEEREGFMAACNFVNPGRRSYQPLSWLHNELSRPSRRSKWDQCLPSQAACATS